MILAFSIQNKAVDKVLWILGGYYNKQGKKQEGIIQKLKP